MDFKRLRIFDYLNIGLFVIFVITFSAIFSYFAWNLCARILRKSPIQPETLCTFDKKIEGLFSTVITTIDMDSVSIETAYESAVDEEKN